MPRGARARAIAWCDGSGGKAWFVNQHSNTNNGDAHYHPTGPEIWEQTEGKLDTMVVGLVILYSLLLLTLILVVDVVYGMLYKRVK